ncbi:nuclear transport factor 2 family protein [Streptomyces sp. KM273126]|uniref:nuclear transport factor 2 family protein n=1 Tax=Streptomyces sp. KM273126 TaxID=2545247 RepID=UPI00103CEFF5|nr:nuclear transport factor 2 family protein [Streptomyces sp. KM273126]MBA2810578.1 nuclear transport factor 2 family protein [Streptomyces sp. KM273126]
MTPEDTTAWALARLNTALYHHYDRLEYEAVLEFFAPDAVYELRGQRLCGHAKILDVLNERPGPEQTTRHIVTATHFHTVGETTARGTITLLGYGGPTPTEPGPAPYTAATGGHIFELADHYRLDHGRWKITHRTAHPILAPIPN